MAGLPASLASHLVPLEAALRKAVGDDRSQLAAACRYVMGWEDQSGRPANAGGKRIRPALCLYAGALFGNAEGAMPGAVAVELVHNFSLIHDEVQDHDAERHGRPTLWALLGTAQAINAGDFLYSRATSALLEGTASPERRLAALQLLTDAVGRMISGQWADLSFESRDDVTTDEYLAMVSGKTGALLGAPLAIGATLAGASPATAEALGRWGEAIGLAFQIRDDYLGIWGNPDVTGKSNTNDIARKKKTLPVIHALMGPGGETIREVYKRPELTEADVSAVIASLRESAADEFTREAAERQAAAATAILDTMDLADVQKDDLRAIGAYLIERDA
jgi:geranylgeranyl diphosphate synthase type I